MLSDAPLPMCSGQVKSAAAQAPRQADSVAFDDLVSMHQAYVARLAQRLLGTQDSPDDAVQEVFLAAFRAYRRFRGEADPRTWLASITANVCRTMHRRRRLRSLLTARFSRLFASARPATGAETSCDDADHLAQLRRAVAGLPPRDREVIVLHYVEQESIDAMTKMLGLRRNTVEARLSRARARLRAAVRRIESQQP